MVCDFRMCIYLDFSLMASVLVFEVTSTSQGHMSHPYPIEFTHCGLKHFFLPLFFFSWSMTLEKQHIPRVVPSAALLKIGFR